MNTLSIDIINDKEYEMNRILDKISNFGIDQISIKERKFLDNISDDFYVEKYFTLNKIRKIMHHACYLPLIELTDEEIVIKEYNSQLHVLEILDENKVEINIYNKNTNEYITYYTRQYNQLSLNILKKILEIL